MGLPCGLVGLFYLIATPFDQYRRQRCLWWKDRNTNQFLARNGTGLRFDCGKRISWWRSRRCKGWNNRCLEDLPLDEPIGVRATLPLQFLVLKSRSSGSRTIHARDNPHKGWDASGGIGRRWEDPAYSGRLSKFHVGRVERTEI